MTVTKFGRYLILDALTGRAVKPPLEHIMDFADDVEGLVSFRSVETTELKLHNNYSNEDYVISVPTSYKVMRRKILIEKV